MGKEKFLVMITKLKALAADEFSDTKVVIPSFDRVENIVGKGENAGYQHFLLFPQYFQKASDSFSHHCVVKS